MSVSRIKGFACGLISTVLWGSFYPVSRALFGNDAEHFDEFFVSFLRFIISFAVLCPLFFIGGNFARAKAAIGKEGHVILLLSLVGIVGEGVLVFVANKYTTAARASLMANTAPIPTVILAFFFAREALTRSKIIGMILGFAGAALAVTARGSDIFSAGASTLAGDLLAFASGLCWAVFTVFGREVTRRYGPFLTTTLLCGTGAFLMIPVMFIAGSTVNFALPPRVWAGVFYLGVSGVLANALWYGALKFIKPGELGSLGYLSALLAAGSSILLLGEEISWSFLISVVAVIFGVVLMANRGERERNPRPVKRCRSLTE